MAYFQKFYENFDIGRSGVIFLAQENGAYLARRPFTESLIGQSLSTSRLFKEFLPKAPVGSAIVTAVADGVERLYAYRHLDNYPLVMFAALSTEEIYAKWLADTYLHWVGVALLAIMLGWLGFRLIHQIQLHVQIEQQLLRTQDAMGKLNKKLEKLALQDGLTGLANRRQFDAVLNNEFNRAMRNSSPLALVMIDVDYFKHYNDIYGHPAGDDCLRTISKVVKASHNRPSDLAARYGGEEIAMLLPDTDLAGAVAVAEKIRLAIFNLGIAHSGNPTGLMTISAGVSVVVPIIKFNTPLELIRTADKALYAAKHEGRNCVCSSVKGEISQVTPA